MAAIAKGALSSRTTIRSRVGLSPVAGGLLPSMCMTMGCIRGGDGLVGYGDGGLGPRFRGDDGDGRR